MIGKKLTKAVLERDKSRCWHCGSTEVILHHRKNRGAGGSKLLDRPDNLITVCAVYNGLMESDSKIAEQARQFGHKLRSWQDFDSPVFDRPSATWYVLGERGEKWTLRNSQSECETEPLQ